MTWSLPAGDDPAALQDGASVTEVPEALVTAFARGPLNTEKGPYRWVTGAVHTADGHLVHASQRQWQGEVHAPIAADPGVAARPADVVRLDGTWLYGGHWSNHFGHFLVETLPNLWPAPSPSVTGILVHRPPRGPVSKRAGRLRKPLMPPWQSGLVRLAGYGDVPVRVVDRTAVAVEHLLVPSRPVLLKRWVQPAAVDLWRRVSDAVGRRGTSERVYLSRTLFNDANPSRSRSEHLRDAELDAEFERAGFAVVHPELLDVEEQVATVRGARVIAGQSGSSLHLSAFAEPGTRILTVGDTRARRTPMRTQTTIDRACGHLVAFVAHEDPDGLSRLLAALDEAPS